MCAHSNPFCCAHFMLMFIVHWHRIVIQIQIHFIYVCIRSEYHQREEEREREIERIVYCHHYYPYSGSTKFSQFKLEILRCNSSSCTLISSILMLGTNSKTSTNKWQVPFRMQTELRIKHYAISITHFQPFSMRIFQICPFHVCQIFFSRRRRFLQRTLNEMEVTCCSFYFVVHFSKPLIPFRVIYVRRYRRLYHVCQR